MHCNKYIKHFDKYNVIRDIHIYVNKRYEYNVLINIWYENVAFSILFALSNTNKNAFDWHFHIFEAEYAFSDINENWWIFWHFCDAKYDNTLLLLLISHVCNAFKKLDKWHFWNTYRWLSRIGSTYLSRGPKFFWYSIIFCIFKILCLTSSESLGYLE